MILFSSLFKTYTFKTYAHEIIFQAQNQYTRNFQEILIENILYQINRVHMILSMNNIIRFTHKIGIETSNSKEPNSNIISYEYLL